MAVNSAMHDGKQSLTNFDQMVADIEETKRYLEANTKHRPSVAVVCGTGLGGLAEILEDTCVFNYTDIPNFTPGTVKGHAGKLVFGILRGVCVVCMQGRIHAYEGHPMWNITFPVRVFGALGVQVLLVTNASGGLNPKYKTGDVMIIKDHINFASLAGRNPLVGLNDERFGERFVPLTGAYDRELRAIARQVAETSGLGDYIQEGVYMCQIGPCFETVSECRMFLQWGADVVGMSTAFEVATARHVGLKVVGISLVTNKCLMDYDTDEGTANHEDNLIVGRQRAEDRKSVV